MISRLTATATLFALASTTVIVLLADAAWQAPVGEQAAREVVQLPRVEITVRSVKG